MAETEAQAKIAQEEKELNAVPKIPIAKYMGGGMWRRCHICGQLHAEQNMKSYDGNRLACNNCHPKR